METATPISATDVIAAPPPKGPIVKLLTPKKAAAKKTAPPKKAAAAKKTTPAPKKSAATGPRSGTITALVVALTKAGKSTEAIAKAVAEKFPKTVFAKEVRADDFHAVAWYVNESRKRGWLPKEK
jgi:hypothetical protein